MATSTRTVTPPRNVEITAWRWMRYSGVALIPLVWIHVLIQDVVVGVHAINNDYVLMRWSSIIWQGYDILLLAFAFAHGMNGLRQVLNDFIHNPRVQKVFAWLILIVWVVLSTIGAIAIIAAASNRLANL